LAHPQDKIFAEQMGGRTVKDDKDEHLAEEKPTFADKMKKASEDALEQKLIGQIYGGGSQGGDGGGGKADSIQATVVTSALTQMNSMVHEANMMAKAKEGEIIQARKEADEARANLFTSQLATIQNMQKDLAAATAKAAEQGTPEAAMGVIKQYGAMMEELRPKVSTDGDAVAVKTRVVSDEVSIRLEEMRQGHEFKMEELKAQMANQNQQFQIQLLQFNEDSRRRWREYEDGKEMKQDALGGFSDLASALSAGISRERGIPAEGEEVVEASVGSFPCEFCKTMVPVVSGSSLATCPKCGASFNIKKK